MTKATVDLKAVLDLKPLDDCVRYAPEPTATSRPFQKGDRVIYQRQDHDGQPLSIVRGFIESLTRTTCVIEEHHTDELAAAALDRVRRI